MQAIITNSRLLLSGACLLGLVGCVTTSQPRGSGQDWKALETAATTTSDKSRVALDTALNALGNAMAEVDALRKTLLNDFYRGSSEASARTVRALTAAWEGEQKAMSRVQDTSVALAVCTNVVAEVSALRLEAVDVADTAQQGKLYRRAHAATREAAEAARAAVAIAEDLKQQWLVAVPPPDEE